MSGHLGSAGAGRLNGSRRSSAGFGARRLRGGSSNGSRRSGRRALARRRRLGLVLDSVEPADGAGARAFEARNGLRRSKADGAASRDAGRARKSISSSGELGASAESVPVGWAEVASASVALGEGLGSGATKSRASASSTKVPTPEECGRPKRRAMPIWSRTRGRGRRDARRPHSERGSVRRPVIADAAATAGDTR